MKLSKKTNTIILWIISLGLLVSMIFAFTPTLGLFQDSPQGEAGAPALLVNDRAISELEILRAQRSPLFSAVTEGEVGQDLQLLLLDQMIDRELLRQAAEGISVSNADVRQAVNEFREAQGVAGSGNDRAYLNLIRNAGFPDDPSFREYQREQLKQQRYIDQVIDEVEVSDEEVEAFYEANRDRYRSSERILARQLVVDDEALANELYERLLAGEDFAELASEYSLERAERGGALGAPEGSSAPEPVGRAALPTQVANAAFGLELPGLTDIISSGGRYHIIQVEERIEPSVRPFDEVANEVREDAQEAKENAALEQRLDELRAQASISVPETSSYSYDNPVVARVGDSEIRAADLARATYLNPQVQQFLSPDSAQLVASLFKPSALEELIEQELAYKGAQDLGLPLVGSKALVGQSAQNYIVRDIEVSEADIEDYYESNIQRFTEPASAVVSRYTFESEDAAMSFREAALEGEALEALLADHEGQVDDLGVVGPGELETAFDSVLFETDAFDALPENDREISDVLVISEEVEVDETDEDDNEAAETDEAAADDDATELADDDDADDAPEGSEEALEEALEEAVEELDEVDTELELTDEELVEEGLLDEAPELIERYVVLVATRSPEQVRSLDEVRSQVEQAVRQQKRREARRAWLDELRERYEVENLVAEADPQPGLDFTTDPELPLDTDPLAEPELLPTPDEELDPELQDALEDELEDDPEDTLEELEDDPDADDDAEGDQDEQPEDEDDEEDDD